MREGTGAGVYGQSVRRKLSFSVGRYVTIFQAEIYAVLACIYEVQFQNRPEKYVSICSDSRAALKAPQAIRTVSPLVQQCQKACGGAVLGRWTCWSVFRGFFDLSQLWKSLDRIYEERLVVEWSTSIGYDGEVLVIPKDRLEN